MIIDRVVLKYITLLVVFHVYHLIFFLVSVSSFCHLLNEMNTIYSSIMPLLIRYMSLGL